MIDPVHESGATEVEINLNGRTNDLFRPFILLPISVSSAFSVAMLLPLRSDAYASSIVQFRSRGSRKARPTLPRIPDHSPHQFMLAG